MKNQTTGKLQPAKTRTDLLIMIILAGLTYALASYYNLFEAFLEWYEKDHRGEQWQIDELIIVFIILAIALSIFSFRRWRELGREIRFRLQIEEELIQMRDAALESSRMKSEFLANMSHEIRTPMNGIIGMTELTLDTNLTREQREYLEMVNSSAFNLLTVINDILDFSKIEAAKLELHSDKFSLRECMAKTIKPLAMRAQEKGLEIALDIAPNTPDNITCDVTRLRQIVINLVGNAIKFTQQGEVILRAQVEAQNEGTATLHLSVSDTGIGIPKDKQELIFNSFTQADGSTSRTYGGTGLGLSISSRLVEMMGGKIWLESEPNQGSVFHATIRIQVRSGVEKVSQRVSPISLIGMSVLVVDDNATNRLILSKMLEGWGMKPGVVDSGPAALLALRQAQESGKPFPLLILDGHMPGMDGFEVAERINQTPELISPTIMMLTSGNQRGDSELCRKLGLAEYVLKPVTQAELLEIITRILGSKLIPPAVRDDSAKNRSDAKPFSSLRPLSILLAEDNLVNQKLMTTILKKQGHAVTTAADGQEALSALTASTFDVVLMDVQMPNMNGFEAVAAIRESEQLTGAHLPVIALTAYAMKGDRERCLEAGMDDYLSKPVRAAELYRVLESVVTVSQGPGTTAP